VKKTFGRRGERENGVKTGYPFLRNPKRKQWNLQPKEVVKKRMKRKRKFIEKKCSPGATVAWVIPIGVLVCRERENER